MNKRSSNVNGRQITEWLLIILSVAAVCLVPCIVQMVPVYRAEEEVLAFGRAGLTLGDAFSFVKSRVLLILTALIILLRAYGLISYVTTEREPDLKKYLKDPVNIFSALYVVCVLISSIASQYKVTVLWGIFERYEGMLILISYIIIFLNIKACVSSRGRLRFFVVCILLFAAVIAAVGALQFVDNDPFATDWGKKLILGKYLKDLISFSFNFNGMVYATLYNPNNAGLYSAVITVFSGVLALLLPYKNILKYVSAALMAAMLLTLAGSHSLGGAIGAAGALVVFVLFSVVYFLRHKRYSEKSGIYSMLEKAALVALVGGAAFIAATSVPSVSSRLEYIITDMNNTIAKQSQEENLYYKSIQTEENKLMIETRDGTFSIEVEEDGQVLSVTDMSGSPVEAYNRKAEYKSENFRYTLEYLPLEGTLRLLDILGNPAAAEDLGEEGVDFRFGERLCTVHLSADEALQIMDEEGNAIDMNQIGNENATFYSNYKLSNGAVFLIKSISSLTGSRYYTYEYQGQFTFAFLDGRLTMLDRNGAAIDMSKPIESFGFENNQLFGSTRGYIWSKTFPLILKNPLFGSGPDSYVYIFPQHDIVGKSNVFNDPAFIVDKPHNFYLQQAVSTGLISLFALFALFALYIADTWKALFIKKISDPFLFSVAMAAFSAIVCFWIGSLNVDSTVSVSPIFWGLLGLGFACNRIIRADEKS